MEALLDLINTNDLAGLKRELVGLNVVDIAEFFEELDLDRLLVIFRLLPKDICADVFSYLTSEQQEHILLAASDSEVNHLVDGLFLDDAIDLLEEVPAGVVKKILKNIDEQKRTLINQFLQYPPNSAGSIMTVEFVEFHTYNTVADSIKIIRKTALDQETVYTCYAIDEKRKLVGIVPLRTLLISDDETRIDSIMTTNIISVLTTDDQEKVADTIRKYDFLSLPVVDSEGRLVGIVTVDDAMDILEDENTEDFEIMAGMAPSEKPYLKSSVLSMARNRIGWLLILMFSSMASGVIIGRFEEAIVAIPLLVSFMPMLTDTGGNAGSQSSTLVIRGLALNELDLSDFFQIFLKELSVSVIVGFALSAANFIRIIIQYPGREMIALTVALSLFFTVVIAKSIGGLLPLIAKFFKVDPAIMAAPLITTIVDVLCLFVYFNVAKVLIHI